MFWSVIFRVNVLGDQRNISTVKQNFLLESPETNLPLLVLSEPDDLVFVISDSSKWELFVTKDVVLTDLKEQLVGNSEAELPLVELNKIV